MRVVSTVGEQQSANGEPPRVRPRAARRRRRENAPGGRTVKHEVWVTAEEELVLQARAQDRRVTVSRLLAESALAPASAGQTRTERDELASELFRVARLLGSLANNVNQLATVANSTGELRPELAPTLAAVRDASARTRELLHGLAGSRR